MDGLCDCVCVCVCVCVELSLSIFPPYANRITIHRTVCVCVLRRKYTTEHKVEQYKMAWSTAVLRIVQRLAHTHAKSLYYTQMPPTLYYYINFWKVKEIQSERKFYIAKCLQFFIDKHIRVRLFCSFVENVCGASFDGLNPVFLSLLMCNVLWYT